MYMSMLTELLAQKMAMKQLKEMVYSHIVGFGSTSSLIQKILSCIG